MPVFIGGSDVDPWVSHDFMLDTAAVFKSMGAEVDLRTYPGMPHTIIADEISRVREMLAEAAAFDKDQQIERQPIRS
jgi:phospholipase/carboxylesterase